MTTREEHKEVWDWAKEQTDETLLGKILMLEYMEQEEVPDEIRNDDEYDEFRDDCKALIDILKTECVRRFAEQTGKKG